MNTIRVVGIDIAKSVFHVYVWMDDGSEAWNKKISRSKLQNTVRQFEPGTLIAMEACSTTRIWGRTFSAMGYPVRQNFRQGRLLERETVHQSGRIFNDSQSEIPVS
ncbi:hypothetical protein NAH04_15295 [Serratia marcescens]|uniref:hypothetical protein n=1 Tax=Gammaproteobacteria TaxID=1236 RepID=UPI0018DC58AB|nr:MULTISPECIES: hypothetical protein [Gammaproteobacteria]MBH8333247.1 hypothetical protein [Pseudomonas aeruginosa]MCK1089148.1 hypothetical protein [Serratia marcescens]MCT4802710.1 hypothetical protein [Serratia marcescens]